MSLAYSAPATAAAHSSALRARGDMCDPRVLKGSRNVCLVLIARGGAAV